MYQLKLSFISHWCTLTFVMTANWASMSRILNQMPMFSARSATARLKMGMKSFSFTARAIQSNPIQIQYHMISNSIFSIIPVPLQYLQPTGSSSNSFLITNRRLSLTSFGVLLIRVLYSIFVNTLKIATRTAPTLFHRQTSARPAWSPPSCWGERRKGPGEKRQQRWWWSRIEALNIEEIR